MLRVSIQFLLTFHHGGDYVFITYIVPNLRVAGLLSYWIKCLLPLSNEILKGKRLLKIIPFPTIVLNMRKLVYSMIQMKVW